MDRWLISKTNDKTENEKKVVDKPKKERMMKLT